VSFHSWRSCCRSPASRSGSSPSRGSPSSANVVTTPARRPSSRVISGAPHRAPSQRRESSSSLPGRTTTLSGKLVSVLASSSTIWRPATGCAASSGSSRFSNTRM